MRALLHNPDNLNLFSRNLPAKFELTDVSAEALISAAERLASNDQLPLLLVGDHALSLLQKLRKTGFVGPILVLANRVTGLQAADLLYGGADDVLSLPVEPRELEARVAAVGRRLRGVIAEKITLGDLDFYLDGQHPRIDGVEMKLSAREYAIMRHLMLHSKRVVAKESIYDALYALCAMPPFDKIIDVYICRLRGKMNKVYPGSGAYIETVPGRGYRMIEPSEMDQMPAMA